MSNELGTRFVPLRMTFRNEWPQPLTRHPSFEDCVD
jgi:hypothetical protein